MSFMPSYITKIGIIAKQEICISHKNNIQKIADFIAKAGKKLFMDEDVASCLKSREKSFTRAELLEKCDLILVLGGDGTILKTAGYMPKMPKIGKSRPQKHLKNLSKNSPHVPLILGVNFGNLGFLAETRPENLQEDLRKIFKNEYEIDERFLMRVNHLRNKKIINTFLALNDAVISQGAFSRLITMGIEIGPQKMVNFKADGVIISSPTGSTGHSLSAGGSIVHPSVQAFIVTPICTTTLSMRPIVIPNEGEIKITIPALRRPGQNVLGITIDGQTTVPIEFGDEIIIKKSSRPFHMARVKGGKSYYQLLRSKLHWGEHFEE